MACERSGRVRDALLARGHDAISCDIEPSDAPGPHITGRAEEVLGDGWDMVIAFPPCTYLANIGLACLLGKCIHNPHKTPEYSAWRHSKAIDAGLLFQALLSSAPRVAVENPQPHRFGYRLMGRPSAYCEPWWFGDPWKKATHWWLRGLAGLTPTAPVKPTARWVDTNRSKPHSFVLPGLHRDPRMRSLTPLGLAEAIAVQWGDPTPQTLF